MPIPRAMSTRLARLTEDSLTLARAAIVDFAAETPRPVWDSAKCA
ncbi:hypothetical protein R3Q08_27405 [Rhodococcus erythropolis]|uniref:Uncharacterized protein n=1 Tax=Rhodococcus erythropolis TaxID=1833 RepID=A0AAX3ZZ31_RHOER|nr:MULTISPECIES: hypothetical protein [Rhodococcus]MCZ4548170.1 hypothetical protein [Rhodococcus qingshengii]MDA3635364.1 hypothetical protein [Rhodococcus sp. C-2]MDJ0407146.1 hypothetical protein [Rhodococcus erythropolis]MDJ0489649.1 hypothetical protein [Rhodococcus qingshengii]MDV6211995.1 hypothetical protein [Rhodococcus erythropolis]